MSIEAVVQRQFEAYNAHDLQRFLAQYAEEIHTYRPPAAEPILVGKAAFAEFYATQRFNKPNLQATLVNRITLGNKVIDHERITGVQDQPFEVAIVYEVANGVIVCTWTFAPA